MGKFNALLRLRLKQKKSNKPKMSALAEKANKGNLSSFSGVFRIEQLNEEEKEKIMYLLETFREKDTYDIKQDLAALTLLTSEVKAITNQAIILHGERIKKAQQILKNYKDGAFTSWLVNTYGNRQTPYNFLQYYDFYSSMPEELKNKMDKMPRQAVYTLASRSGDQKQKLKIVKNYSGEQKQELLNIIRKIFPLESSDKRTKNVANHIIDSLCRLKSLLSLPSFRPSKRQKQQLHQLIEEIEQTLKL